MNFYFLKKTNKISDTHEKPWGGVYARRLWRWMLGATFFVLIVSTWFNYRLYVQYTGPIVISTSSLASQIVQLDVAGLAKAVDDIKDKEAKFNQYLTQKVEITDPAQ